MAHGIVGFTRKIEYAAAKSKLFYWIVSQYYRNVIKNEIDLANITNDDHILCIGGGFCPFSAILFHKITGAKVTVIDNCKECVREARHIIDRLGLGDHIRTVWQDGGNMEFSLSEFSVVHFALQVFPMDSVFPQVKKHVVPGTKLLVRRPKKTFEKMYSELSGSLLNCCRHITHQKACNIGSTLLYIKQERLHEKKMAVPSGPVAVRAADSAVSFPCPVAV